MLTGRTGVIIGGTRLDPTIIEKFESCAYFCGEDAFLIQICLLICIGVCCQGDLQLSGEGCLIRLAATGSEYNGIQGVLYPPPSLATMMSPAHSYLI